MNTKDVKKENIQEAIHNLQGDRIKFGYVLMAKLDKYSKQIEFRFSTPEKIYGKMAQGWIICLDEYTLSECNRGKNTDEQLANNIYNWMLNQK